jgi:hypothetical protein
MNLIVASSGLLLAALAFVIGWVLGSRRATAKRLEWHYATCATFIGLRKCLDEKSEDLREYLTHMARMQYGLWREGPRVNPPPFSPSTDELFAIADREFAALKL